MIRSNRSNRAVVQTCCPPSCCSSVCRSCWLCHPAIGVFAPLKPNAKIKEGKFGYTTNAINGPLECKGPYTIKAFRRFVIYAKVLEAFSLLKTFPPKQDGCYPLEGKDAPGYKLCRAIGSYKNQAGMFHWCNDNCNTEHSNCPKEMCLCS